MWPTITANGSTIAFERDFGVWTYDVAGRSGRERGRIGETDEPPGLIDVLAA
jgi:hypothetical protein